MSHINLEDLKQLLHYDQHTGEFTWLKTCSNRAPAGKVAGTRRKSSPYIIISIHRRLYYAHRLAWFYVHGSEPDGMLDHIDNDHSNNRIENLRLATYSQNVWNTKRNRKNTSGFKGVWKAQAGKFPAYIKANGSRIRIGLFETAEEAGRAYEDAARKYHGEYAKT